MTNHSRILSILFFLVLTFQAKGLPEDPAELRKWEEGMLQAIEKQAAVPPNEAIPKLGTWLIQLNNVDGTEQGDRPVFTAAKKMMLSIPGHAEYYGIRINEEREKVDQGRAEGLDPHTTDLGNMQMYGFKTLSYLPSPETVRVLGGFLHDERGKDNLTGLSGERTGEFPNHYEAMRVLSQLPISNPPTQEIRFEKQFEDGLKAWRQWYAEVKSGRRTFRFIGDDMEYDLRGPVRRGGLTADRSVKRPVDVPQEEAVIAKPEPESTRFLPYVIGVMFLLAGAFIYVRGKKRRA